MRVSVAATFFCSGAIALVYEGAWQRQFTLLFGSAAPATAAVLAAYFAGLGLGSFVMGIVGPRLGRPLLIYALLEVAVAVGALLVTPLLGLYAGFYPQLFENFQGEAAFLWVKGALAFVSIALPTFAMGGTLPILVQIFEADRANFGRSAGWLYVLNTLGAGMGAVSFPVLFASAGLKLTTLLCAAGNLLIAVAAFTIFRRASGRVSLPAGGKSGGKAASVQLVRTCFGLSMISGFVAFALQVAWNRAFAQIHENSIQSFTLIVSLFIFAIAMGGELARVFLRRGISWHRALGRAWMAAGTMLLIAPKVFIALSDGLRFVPAHASYFNLKLLFPALIVFIPVALLAMSLPLILQALAIGSPRSVADLTGRALAWNIAGSVGGALAAGFLLPRYFGLWNSIIGCGVLVAVVGCLTGLRSSTVRWACVGSILLLGGLFGRAELPKIRVDLSRQERVIHVREGTHGIVAVVDRGSGKMVSRRLKLNNHYVLGGTSATGDERLQGHIPLLLHAKPNSVAFLGYGTGITASSALFHPVTNVIALELVPEVVGVAHDYFFDQAFSERFPVIKEDARNYLRGTRKQFDVLVGDLVVPWRQGEGALYTLEHFQAARERLTRGGLYCCWLPMFQLSREEFELILRTFLAVFPQTQVWRGDFSPTEPALALIGWGSGEGELEVRLARMKPDPANPHLRFPSAFWMQFVGLITNAVAGPLNREDKPILELRGARRAPFVGRALAEWEQNVQMQSAHLEKAFDLDQLAGWRAGGLMREYTLLLLENRKAEAARLDQEIRSGLSEEAARSVLGP